jgi:hypothetical protein
MARPMPTVVPTLSMAVNDHGRLVANSSYGFDYGKYQLVQRSTSRSDLQRPCRSDLVIRTPAPPLSLDFEASELNRLLFRGKPRHSASQPVLRRELLPRNGDVSTCYSLRRPGAVPFCGRPGPVILFSELKPS